MSTRLTSEELAKIIASATRAAGAATAAFERFGAAVASFGMAATRIQQALGLSVADQLAARRRIHGGNGSDAVRFPDQWQSTACTAWLHESCPSDEHDLHCTCTHHDTRTC